ncbi:MAG: SMP-30/gluconolactonase/LRE family protein [Bacteroidota bacterium]
MGKTYLSHLFALWSLIGLGLWGSCSPDAKPPMIEHALSATLLNPIPFAPMELGEGALWHPLRQELWWVDIEGKKLYGFQPASQTTWQKTLPSRIGTVVPQGEDQAIVALEDGVYRLGLSTDKLEKIAEVEAEAPRLRLNDGKCDPLGNLWVGSLQMEDIQPVAALYRVNEAGEVKKMLGEVQISNGICWSLDGQTLYYIDTPLRNVRAFDFAAGEISGEKVVIEFPEGTGYPDGMTMDEAGNLWIAMWAGKSVQCWDPRTGKKLAHLAVDALNVTSVAFGGSQLDTLYITTASIGMTEAEKAQYPKAGKLFYALPGVKGMEAAFFGAK